MNWTRVPLALFALVALATVSACSTSNMRLAPTSPTTPYRGTAGEAAVDPGTADFSVTPDASMPISIAKPQLDAKHVYSLAELIDISQMANPVTQAAWQRARQAASAVGAAEAVYLPILSADVLAGYARTSATASGLDIPSVPIATIPGVGVISSPEINIPSGTVTTEGSQIAPTLAVSWLLFDFGGRDAALASARELSFAANVNFNAAHQKLIFDVSNAYFKYNAARAQTQVNRESLKNAKLVQTAAEARLEQGIATTMEVAQAKQQVAQAKFDLTQTTSAEQAFYQSLLAAMGISPTAKIRVKDNTHQSLPRAMPTNLDKLVIDSLQRRPDVQAAFARVKAGEQGIVAAEAEFMPKVALTGNVNRTWGSYDVRDNRFSTTNTLDTNQPNAAIMVGLSFPIFDGGLRRSRLDAATAQAEASKQEFAQLQSKAAQEIVIAYDLLQTSLSGTAAAAELVKAARTNHEAALDYYKNGLGTLSDVSVAQTGLLKALFAEAQARSDVFSAAASLAFTTGMLTNSQVP